MAAAAAAAAKPRQCLSHQPRLCLYVRTTTTTTKVILFNTVVILYSIKILLIKIGFNKNLIIPIFFLAWLVASRSFPHTQQREREKERGGGHWREREKENQERESVCVCECARVFLFYVIIILLWLCGKSKPRSSSRLYLDCVLCVLLDFLQNSLSRQTFQPRWLCKIWKGRGARLWVALKRIGLKTKNHQPKVHPRGWSLGEGLRMCSKIRETAP